MRLLFFTIKNWIRLYWSIEFFLYACELLDPNQTDMLTLRLQWLSIICQIESSENCLDLLSATQVLNSASECVYRYQTYHFLFLLSCGGREETEIVMSDTAIWEVVSSSLTLQHAQRLSIAFVSKWNLSSMIHILKYFFFPKVIFTKSHECSSGGGS